MKHTPEEGYRIKLLYLIINDQYIGRKITRHAKKQENVAHTQQ